VIWLDELTLCIFAWLYNPSMSAHFGSYGRDFGSVGKIFYRSQRSFFTFYRSRTHKVNYFFSLCAWNWLLCKAWWLLHVSPRFFVALWAMAFSLLRFVDHSQRWATVIRTSLEEQSALSRGLYLTKHNTHKRRTSITSAGLEPAFPASERPQTFTLDRTATGIDTTRLNTEILRSPYTACLCVLCGSQTRHHYLIGFHNRDRMCLLRGTDWIFKCNSGYS
jgi:hypothetical protein